MNTCYNNNDSFSLLADTTSSQLIFHLYVEHLVMWHVLKFILFGEWLGNECLPFDPNRFVFVLLFLKSMLYWIISRISASLWPWTKSQVKETGECSKEDLNGINAMVKAEPGETLNLKHGKTHYILQGPVHDKSAPLVVFLHGASVFSFIWSRFAHSLASKGYRVLSFGNLWTLDIILYIFLF